MGTAMEGRIFFAPNQWCSVMKWMPISCAASRVLYVRITSPLTHLAQWPGRVNQNPTRAAHVGSILGIAATFCQLED